MTQNGSRRQPNPDNSSLILGILIGVVLGLSVAGGMAWYLTHHRPDMFTQQSNPVPAQPQHASASTHKPPATGNTPASGAAPAGKNNYTFYTLLPDGKHANSHGPSASAPVRQAAAGKTYYLQAGSFTNEEEANGLRQKLAFLGLETQVQAADIPGKGRHYRVRLGPYHSSDEISKASQTLKKNGVAHPALIRIP